MNFSQAVEYLLSLGHETLTMKLGLRSTEILLEALGNPERCYRSVQIAGTNGKGSTAVMLDSICREAHINVGLYTSPHLVSITQRININGRNIEPDVFAKHATAVRNAAESLVAKGRLDTVPTFFEQVTAIAFLAFKEAGVDLAILETGLGGRLDSTTTAKAAIVAITQIAFDHQEYLGDTLAEIAAEKAAIIHPGVKAIVVSNDQPPEALDIIRARCETIGVYPQINDSRVEVSEVSDDGRFCVTFTTPNAIYERVWLGLRGRHQINNGAVAIQLAESLRRWFDVSLRAICDGIASAKHAGRLELVRGRPSFLLDGAHNPAGAASLREHLERFVSLPITMIFGAMRDKQLEAISELLFPVVNELILTPVNNQRTADVLMVQKLANRHLASAKIKLADSSGEALTMALEKTPPTALICVTGSLYLLGELRPQIIRLHDLEVA